MRGGTSKGVFISRDDLPTNVRNDPRALDRVLLRVIGSPDPYGNQLDGMGGATSSTSKVVLISKSSRDDCDVDYLFGQVSIDSPVIDWSGNCGNLTTAVGPFAITRGLIVPPKNGVATVRIWQANIQKRILAYVPVSKGEVVERGNFELDGVTFPAAEVRLEFLDVGGDGDSPEEKLFPSGKAVEILSVPGVGDIEVTLINAGNPTVFIDASALGLQGVEKQDDVNTNAPLLTKLEAIRAHGAVAMGLASSAAEATASRPATPKVAFVNSPGRYVASNGAAVEKEDIDILVRILSMGKLHHAITGTGAVAVAAAAAIPTTIVARTAKLSNTRAVRIGHPSGTLTVGSEVRGAENPKDCQVDKVLVSRTARRLMDGVVFVPDDL